MKKLRKIIFTLFVASFVGLFASCDLMLDAVMLYGTWDCTDELSFLTIPVKGTYTFNDDLSYEQRIFNAESDEIMVVAKGTWMIQKDNSLGYNTMTITQKLGGFDDDNLMDIESETTYKYALSGNKLTLQAISSDGTLGSNENYKKR